MSEDEERQELLEKLRQLAKSHWEKAETKRLREEERMRRVAAQRQQQEEAQRRQEEMRHAEKHHWNVEDDYTRDMRELENRDRYWRSLDKEYTQGYTPPTKDRKRREEKHVLEEKHVPVVDKILMLVAVFLAFAVFLFFVWLLSCLAF